MAVLLNVDLGELEGEPVELYELCSLVNVATGGHAGDEESMRVACERARVRGVRVAAHPSYPDREGFGRRELAIGSAELGRALATQLEGFARIAATVGVTVVGVKPHGALYHRAARDEEVAELVVLAALEAFGPGVALVGPPEGAMANAAAHRGHRYFREGFADRAYDGRGGLVPRGAPGALVVDPARAAEQALRLARSQRFETLCVHGDTEDALGIVRAVRARLEEEGLLA